MKTPEAFAGISTREFYSLSSEERFERSLAAVRSAAKSGTAFTLQLITATAETHVHPYDDTEAREKGLPIYGGGTISRHCVETSEAAAGL